ncbi:hypothetical protein M422DRAFT_262394 [Sphaerobolus stellatus SS14]|uniref:Uncharacterized protein n=1 Tax=Sphaerobolus stellatus (strain SS14) TaxID=990650 RepID=A0A0C9TY85_SPHS4|nr:hypothetical protein M422DRAFT_262394 [Sphaerobolus stellatus SS14]
MAYNLIFEIVHGNIQFPGNSDAKAANGTFHARINQIINLYTDAKQSSYGVRDELQASIQTVKTLLPTVKQKMAAYVNAKTVIWIPFRIYFDFWIRYIQELKFLQIRVTKQRPSNACNLTLLHMYLIKSIVANPREDSFTRFVLQDLNFQPSSQHFGIFFHPTLHCHTLAVHQMEQDEDPVIQHVTNTYGKHKKHQKDIEEDPRRTEHTKSEHDILCLQDGLQAAFELLECLPDKKKTGINSQPWKYHPEKGGPSFIVNAKAYKIHGIGPPKKNTNLPHPRAIATHTRIEALLLADNFNNSFNHAVKHIKGNNWQAQKQDRCSTKHKNKRKTPQKIQRGQGSSANKNQEIQPEHLEENSEELNGDPIQEKEQDHSEEESDYFNIESEDSEDV